MASVNLCNVCDKKVLKHSYYLRCELCEHMVHLKCLPKVDKTHSIYVCRDSSSWYCIRCTEEIFPYNHIYDDAEFVYALSENWGLSDAVSFEILNQQNLLFSPFDLNENLHNPLSETDPDIHYYNNHCNFHQKSCEYWLENSFNERVRKNEINNNSFSLLHANIRSA